VNNQLILKVQNLAKHFSITKNSFSPTGGCVKAVDGISFDIPRGETMGIVGESGCGKSTTAKMIVGLVKPTQGEVYFLGRNILDAAEKGLKVLRRDLQIIFQDSSGSLNPRMTAGELISEPLIIHGVNRHERKLAINQLMDKVGLAEYHANRFPHEFSGGQRQRIGIARALALNPKFIICDEPLSALDVSVQSQIINLLKDLQMEYNLTYLFISHDLAVVSHLCDTVAIMYLGKIIESGPADRIFSHPLHPYTKALLSSVPVPDPLIKRKRITFTGDIPNAISYSDGCGFYPRCPYAQDICRNNTPEFNDPIDGHSVACHIRESH
jgi:oligopeptide transport system ATP-binding protein